MESRKSLKGFERLHADMGFVLRPGGDHLSWDTMVQYTLGALSLADVETCDRHLLGCEECSDDMDRLLAIEESVDGLLADEHAADEILSDDAAPTIAAATAWGTEATTLWKNLQAAFTPIAAAFNQPAGPAPAFGFASDVFKGSTPDQKVSWRGVRQLDGSLHLMIGSSEEVLKDAEITLGQGRLAQVLRLVDVGGGQAGTEIVISKDDWQRLSKGPLLYRIVLKDGTVIMADDVEQ